MDTEYRKAPPGVVISHLPASAKRFIGSPSVAVLSDGSYVASHDVFGPGSTYNTGCVFRSTDRGHSWVRIAELDDLFWSGLFVHRDTLYLMGTTGQFKAAAVRKSVDGGMSWSRPSDAANGLIRDDGMYHTAPVPVVEHCGRLWRAMEDMHPTVEWGRNFRALMLSADADGNLLDAACWTESNRLPRDASWLGGSFGGWLEGNAVVDPEGGIVDALRVDYRVGDGEYAAIVRVSAEGHDASFDPSDFIRFPGGCKKFSIRRDPVAGVYWALSNIVAPGFEGYNVERTRNTLALMRSEDLRGWTVTRTILHHPQVEDHAFQYADWQFDGDDLVVVSRTAYDDGLGGAHNQHDANFLTFHRVEGFAG